MLGFKCSPAPLKGDNNVPTILRAGRAVRYMKYLRLFRLVRIVKFDKFYSEMRSGINSNFVIINFYYVFFFFFFVFLFEKFSSCSICNPMGHMSRAEREICMWCIFSSDFNGVFLRRGPFSDRLCHGKPTKKALVRTKNASATSFMQTSDVNFPAQTPFSMRTLRQTLSRRCWTMDSLC